MVRSFLLSLATLTALAVPASAAPVIESGQYLETVQTSCKADLLCTVSFTAVPSGKYLWISDIGCQVTVGSSGVLHRLHLESRRTAAGSGPVAETILKPVSLAPSSSHRVYQSQDAVRHIVLGKGAASESGSAVTSSEVPDVTAYVTVKYNDKVELYCSLVGVLKSAI